MRREGAPEDNLAMEDFLCDFCHRPWDDERPMVEGHQGACICGACLTVAYTELVLLGVSSTLNEGETCRMCLEERPGEVWRSPAHDDATICKRCIKQAAGVLHKDPDFAWTKPRIDNVEA
ncbi:MAG: ClpX C4-type zinc finger protein [Planctomycetota bacterium]